MPTVVTTAARATSASPAAPRTSRSTRTVVPSTTTSARPPRITQTTRAVVRPPDRVVTSDILAAVNRYRQQAGVAVLQETSCADASALIHAKDQAAAGRMYHRTLNQIETACKLVGGENIAYGYATPAAALAGWWASPGHRANMLDARYRYMGVAVAYGTDGTPYYTQVFYIP